MASPPPSGPVFLSLPEGCKLFQLSVDGGDLGRTYSTELAVVGDIQFSLQVLNRRLPQKTAKSTENYEAARQAARLAFAKREETLNSQADALLGHPVIHPLVAARALAEAIGPDTPIVDEANATAGPMDCGTRKSACHLYHHNQP